MAVSLLRKAPRISVLTDLRVIVAGKRLVMTTRPRLDKVLEDLKRNPYFDKYSRKIAKLQETEPDEFLQRVESREQKVQRKKVPNVSTAHQIRSSWTISFPLTRPQPRWPHVAKRHYSSVPENVYVTTPIFYVNAGPHIGHLYTAVLADAVSRYNSMHGRSAFLCTGTDEHGTKVQKAANAGKLPIPEYCTQVSRKFREMCDGFQVDYSLFIRTTEERHRVANTLEERGHIYLGKYSGWYCVSDEAFLSDAELTEAKDTSGKTIKVSTESGNPVDWTEEDSYKFRLSKFQDDLRHWLKDEKTVTPAKYHKVLSDMVEEGSCLQDLSISRLASRVPWAIPTPSDNSHSIYVWMDALVNYLTALGYPDNSYRKFWPPTIQVVGKDILKFHGIFWPAFLIAAGLEPPRTLLCHAHWTVDNLKMSKSKGNVISPFDAAQSFTADGLRYFLLRQAVPYSDANYNATKVQRILNSELAHTLGNLVNRCLGKSLNPDGEIPDIAEHADVLTSDVAVRNKESLESLGETTRTYYEEYNTHHVVDSVMSMLHTCNQMVDHHKPWQLRKQTGNSEAAGEMRAVISLALESVRVAAIILYPIVPRLSSDLLDFLQVPKNSRTWRDTRPLYLGDTCAGSRHAEPQTAVFFKAIRTL